MLKAKTEIKKNQIICLDTAGAYPVIYTKSFLNAKFKIINSEKNYKKGEEIILPILEQDDVTLTKNDVKKLIKARDSATGKDKKNITDLISQKIKSLSLKLKSKKAKC